MTYNPLPSVQTAETGHSTQCPTEDTTESTGQDRTTKEKGDSLVDFVSAVPARQEKVETGKETGFKETEHESHGQQSLVRLDQAH